MYYSAACGCDPIGTEVTTDCSISSGTCDCKQGIGGTFCDRCIPSYFNFSSDGCTGIKTITVTRPVNKVISANSTL